jgi:hypothetical protein
MGIVLAVRKKNTICIAFDTMTVSGGSRKQTAAHVLGPEKIVKWGSGQRNSIAKQICLYLLELSICHKKSVSEFDDP